jgi:hypothetical protein
LDPAHKKYFKEAMLDGKIGIRFAAVDAPSWFVKLKAFAPTFVMTRTSPFKPATIPVTLSAPAVAVNCCQTAALESVRLFCEAPKEFPPAFTQTSNETSEI